MKTISKGPKASVHPHCLDTLFFDVKANNKTYQEGSDLIKKKKKEQFVSESLTPVFLLATLWTCVYVLRVCLSVREFFEMSVLSKMQIK